MGLTVDDALTLSYAVISVWSVAWAFRVLRTTL